MLPSSVKKTNEQCWSEAQRFLVGGVNSPVRSFRSVGGFPFFVDRGEKASVWDVEGNRYIDYVCSWGALILGHRSPAVMAAVNQALEKGTMFGTPTPGETELAKQIHRAIPSMERIRFVSSGTEAVMSAVRVARAATGRSKIIKFDGAYHGHADSLLAKAGSGVATLGIPGSAGVPDDVVRDTMTLPFNDSDAVEKSVSHYRKKIACILVEPVMANIGLIPPKNRFLKFLRELATKEGIVLIFDEVITGFRVGFGGAQGLYKIKPDMTILGKIIGGGFPVGAYGGKKKLMDLVAPTGPVYQAGTLSGHPIAMAAGLATIKILSERGNLYSYLEQTAKSLEEGLTSSQKTPVMVQRVGSLFSLFFSDHPVENAAQARRCRTEFYKPYFRNMLRQGIYPPPSAFETWFISAAHGKKEIAATIEAHRKAMKGLGNV